MSLLLRQQLGNFPVAVMEFLGFHTGLLEEGEPVVGEGGVFFGKLDVAAVPDAVCASSGEEGRHTLEAVARAEVAAVAGNAAVVEAAAFGVLGFFEAVEEPGKDFH